MTTTIAPAAACITGVMIAVVLGGGVLFLANQSENVELQLGINRPQENDSGSVAFPIEPPVFRF